MEFENKVYEYIIYSGILFAATLIFMALAYFYKYVEDQPKEDENEKKSKH